MKMTREILKSWGATCNLDWFDAAEGTVAELAKIPPDKYARLWFLREIAARVDGPEGDEALALLVNECGEQEASWIAWAIVHCGKRDRRGAMRKLRDLGDANALYHVARDAEDTHADEALATLARVADDATLEYCERELPDRRRQALQRGRRGR